SGLVVVDVGSGDRLHEFPVAENPLEVLQDLAIALDGFGLVGRMHADMFQEHGDRFRDRGCALFLRGLCNPFATGDKLPDEFVCLAALRFQCLTWRLPRHLPVPFSPFPPFDEEVAGALVPHVTAVEAMERDEAPEACSLANLLDDPNAFLECHCERL